VQLADGYWVGYSRSQGSLAIKGQSVVWTNAVGVEIVGNTLNKTAGSRWGNAGASSVQRIRSGSGYIEFTAMDAGYRMAGLSHLDADQTYQGIDFAINLGNGVVSIYERGVMRGPYPLTTYVAGDVFRIEVTPRRVEYVKNGTVIYTSGQIPIYPLVFDTSLYDRRATITDARMGSPVPTSPLSVQNVVWEDAVGVSIADNTVTKTAGDGWNAGASSMQRIASGDGYAEFRATENTSYRMAGLSPLGGSQNYATIAYAIELTSANADPHGAGRVSIYENGVLQPTKPASYTTGDVFRIVVAGGIVRYFKNRELLYMSHQPPVYPLLFGAALYTPQATIAAARIATDAGSPLDVGVASARGSGARPLAAERDPRAFDLELVQQAHHVVGRELDQHRRDLRVQVVAQLRLERLQRGHEALLLAADFLLRDLTVRERARERIQLLRLFLNQRVFRFVVEPARARHGSSFRSG
jgi:hypothetical protein